MPPALLAGLGAGLALALAWGAWERGEAIAAGARAAQLGAAVAERDAALEALRRQAEASARALETVAAEAAQRTARDRETRRMIHAAPPSASCAAAPAVRAALDGLRARGTAGGAGGAPVGAARPAALRGGAAAAP